MSKVPQNVLSCGSALATVALGWLLTFLLPSLSPIPPLLLLVVVTLAARWGGRGPALLAVGLSVIALACHTLPLAGSDSLLPLGAFLLVGGLICWLLRHPSPRRETPPEPQPLWLRAVLSGIRDAVIATDREGRVLLLNPAARTLLGCDEAVVGRHLGEFFHLLDESTRTAIENPLALALREGAVGKKEKHTLLVAPDAAEIPIDHHSALVRDEAGGIVGCVLTFRSARERRRDEETRARLAAIVESCEDAIIGKTVEGVIVSWNAAAERLFGYSAEEVCGRSTSLLIPPELPDELTEIMARIGRGEHVRPFETVRVRKDGRRISVSVSISPIKDPLGRVIGASAIARDVSERKREEAALRESEERFRQLAQNIEDVFWLADLRLAELIYVSPAYEKVWGRSCASLYDRPHSFLEAVHPKDRDWVAAAILGGGVGEGFAGEFRIVRPDGSHRWISVRSAPIRDEQGQAYRLAGITTDVTARKQVEERLAYQAQLLDEVNDAIIAADTERRITSWNRAAERMYGWRAEEVLGAEINRVVPVKVDQGSREQVLREVVEHGVWRGEAVHWGRDGREMVVDWSIAVIRGLSGEILGTVAINRDVTGLKESQRQALQAERLAAIGQVVAGIAHESGNALQGVRACLERLALRLQGQPETLDLVERAQKEQDRLQRLYDDVRRYAAPVRLEPGECRLDEVWRAAWSQLADTAAGRQILFVEETAGVELRCTADGFRLEQVFRNVFDNALAACSDPVRLEIHGAETEIEGRPALRVAVRDNGPGLTAEQRQKMFEPFFTTKTKGTGLGLAISKRLVEAHGGHIAAGEATGQGAEIILTLPRRQP